MTKKKNLDAKVNNANQKVMDKSKKIKKNFESGAKDKKLEKHAISNALAKEAVSTSKISGTQDVVKSKKDKQKYKTADAGSKISAKTTKGASNGSPLKINTKKRKGKHDASNGSPAKDKVKPKKNKQQQSTGGSETKDDAEKKLAKIEKKKAKKLAKKLKKKELKKAEKSEKQNTDGKEVDNKVEIQNKSSPKASSKPKKNNKPTHNKDSNEPRMRDPDMEAATVFVGNLPVNTKRIQLVRLFSDYAPVNGVRFRSACGKVLFKHKQKKEAGSLTAWVVLKDEATAKRALDLNGTLFKNNHLRVTSRDLGSSTFEAKRTIFVGNLKYSANEEKLREIFSSCGDIDYVRCLHDDKGCKGVAYVCFKAPEAVGLALELNETMLDERPINVERYSIKKLGAKAKRESTGEEACKASVVGKKLKDKKQVDTKAKNSPTKKLDHDSTVKKSKFRGVKIDGGIKKKQKKKQTSQMQKLAKKIAPMSKP